MSLSTRFQPLYKQVYELLVERLVNNHWKPSEPLPSEFALADELGVSQGTVRKALNQMVDEQLLTRRQGKGTYVAEHTQESSLFRFFRFKEPGGEKLLPDTVVISKKVRLVKPKEANILNLEETESVCEMIRVRSLLGVKTVLERVIQPLSTFPGIETEAVIPNALYSFYQEKYGISIVRVQEELRATTLNPDQAELLDKKQGDAVLMVERSSINIDGRVVEWSQALCSTDRFVYSVDLR